jgi:hypothetical protein
MPWIKLHTSRLDDSTFARLTDSQNWRYVQLELLAGKLDAGGAFIEHGQELSEQDLAWKLRLSLDLLKPDLQALAAAGLLCKNGHGWYLPEFEEQQGPTQADKRAAWVDRQKKHREDHAIVTGDKIVTGSNVTPTDIESDIESESEKESESYTSSSSSPETTTTDDDQSIRKIFRAAGVRKQELKYLASTAGIQPADCWAMLAWAFCQETVKQPGKIMAMNILAGERASADWYDESKWVAIPLAIRKAGGLIVQSQEKQEDQLPIVATRSSLEFEGPMSEAEYIWLELLRSLTRAESTRDEVSTSIPVSFKNDVLVIRAASLSRRDWLEARMAKMLKRVAAGIVNRPINIQFVSGEETTP